jgi:starvation-inducible DNA-binding protein
METSLRHRSRNSVPEKVRVEVAGLLQAHLAQAIDLMMNAKQAHWNIKGPSFIALHELFDKIAEDAEDYVDLIAERIVQYGGTAEGTIRVTAKRSALPEYPTQASTEKEHVSALSHSLASFGETVRQAISQCDELEDKATADLYTEISRAVDKYLWMVEAHEQA